MAETLDFGLTQALLQSDKPFPADFEQAWQWSGYPTRRGAKSKLTDNFVEGTHYISFKQPSSQSVGRFKTVFWLSTECLKCFALMAGTQKGRETNLQLIKTEALLKATICQSWSETITKISLAISLLLLSPWMKWRRGRRDRYLKILSAEYSCAIALFMRFGAVAPENLLPFLDLELKLKKLAS